MIFFTSLAHSAILWTATPSPDPSLYPEYNGDANLVTPGVVGFLATLFIAVAVVLLIVDMNRRVRRVRYRALAQETIRNEQAIADGTVDGTGDGADSGVVDGIDSEPSTTAASDSDDADDDAGSPKQ